MQPSYIYGTRHLFKSIQLCNYLPNDLKNIVPKTIQRNAYFVHPENILLCMIWDERKHIRQLAYQRILKARAVTDQNIRVFQTPDLNFEATEYYEMVDCQTVLWTEPPITVRFTNEELKEIIEDPLSSVISYIKGYPCHTQSVERAVKIVTEASLSVCGYERRDGVIRSKLESRSKMPKQKRILI